MTIPQRIVIGASLLTVLALSTVGYMWLAFDTWEMIGGGAALVGFFIVAIGAWNRVF